MACLGNLLRNVEICEIPAVVRPAQVDARFLRAGNLDAARLERRNRHKVERRGELLSNRLVMDDSELTAVGRPFSRAVVKVRSVLLRNHFGRRSSKGRHHEIACAFLSHRPESHLASVGRPARIAILAWIGRPIRWSASSDLAEPDIPVARLGRFIRDRASIR